MVSAITAVIRSTIFFSAANLRLIAGGSLYDKITAIMARKSSLLQMNPLNYPSSLGFEIRSHCEWNETKGHALSGDDKADLNRLARKVITEYYAQFERDAPTINELYFSLSLYGSQIFEDLEYNRKRRIRANYKYLLVKFQ